jgi:hypothetical protein
MIVDRCQRWDLSVAFRRPRSLVAVHSGCRRDRGTRGLLARCVAVLAVFAGLVVLLSPRCADGMILDMPLVGGATAEMACHSGTAPRAGGDATEGTAMLGQLSGPSGAEARTAYGERGAGQGDPRGAKGILDACLVFLVAALAALMALARPRASWIVAVPRLGPHVPMGRPFPARELGLARLCVLRT